MYYVYYVLWWEWDAIEEGFPFRRHRERRGEEGGEEMHLKCHLLEQLFLLSSGMPLSSSTSSFLAVQTRVTRRRFQPTSSSLLFPPPPSLPFHLPMMTAHQQKGELCFFPTFKVARGASRKCALRRRLQRCEGRGGEVIMCVARIPSVGGRAETVREGGREGGTFLILLPSSRKEEKTQKTFLQEVAIL